MYTIDQLQQIKVLGDNQRLAILRRLMDRPATLSQLGEHFGASPAHIRHHLKALEDVGLVELSSTHPVRGFLEKYYRATQRAYLVQLTVVPEASENKLPVIIGSNDPALQQVMDAQSHPACSFLNLDSLEGLVRLREGICEMATIHLLDSESGEYNRAFVRHFFPGEEMALVRLFHREEGLLVQPGNPLELHGIEDLARPGVRMVNRERGAGTRIWFDQALAKAGISRDLVSGYTDEVHSHGEVAAAVAAGKADVGLGLPPPGSAWSSGLDFIPLFDEPYDLVLSRSTLSAPDLSQFLEQFDSKPFGDSV
ncbi:MAG TPA: substrate-binding domain-containing protein, partial [Candidatus Methylomirabilis sp.]|nr:substrate-binding domain-containing protein [Candidatus Methylomirabilis sp.]